MHYFQIISPVEKGESIGIVGAILDMLDEPLHMDLREQYLPQYERESKIAFKVPLISLRELWKPPSPSKFARYEKYLTDFLIAYTDFGVSNPWKNYRGKFLKILMDDNTFALNENLSADEVNMLLSGMKKTSLAIGEKLKEFDKSYECTYLNSREVIDSYKV